MTAVANTAFTAAQFNIYVRDNLNCCAPAAATAGARWIVTTGFNSLAERIPSVYYQSASDTTGDTSYRDLATYGPDFENLVTGFRAIISIGCRIGNSTAGWGGRMSIEVSGDSTQEAHDGNSFYVEAGNVDDNFKGTWTTIFETLTAGSNTFVTKYRAVGGATATFSDRLLMVIGF